MNYNNKLEYINYLRLKNDLELQKDKNNIGGAYIDKPIANQCDSFNYVEPSKTQLYTIPRGTILYHGSLDRESFNPYNIKLSDDKLVAYFSPNKRLSADYIIGCAIYPIKRGFLHKFRVKKNIEKLLIISSYEKKNHWTLKNIDNSFCSRRHNMQLDGIGFFFPKKFEQAGGANNIAFDAEFAICNPDDCLEYVSTQACSSMRKLSKEYHFSQ